nr:hypothetical protein BaRGS_009763 [Batillaria attramentaria]
MTLNARLSSYGNKSANKDSDSTESDGQTTELLREFIEYEKREQGRDEGKRVKLWWRATEHSDEEADQGKGSPKRSKGKKGKARDKSPDQSSRRQKPVPMYGLGPRKPDSHGQYVILHNTQYQLETDTVTTEGPLHLRPDVTSFQSETDTVTHEGLRRVHPNITASGGGKPEPKMLVWGVVPPSQGQSGAPPPPGSAGAWPSLKWARITAPLSADQGETDTGDTRDKTGVKTGGQTGVKTSGQTGVKTGGQTGQRDANPSPAHTSLIDDTKRFIDTRQTTSRPVTVWTEREKRAFYKYMGELMLALCLLTFLALLLDVSPHLFITVVLGANLTLTVFRFQITQG